MKNTNTIVLAGLLVTLAMGLLAVHLNAQTQRELKGALRERILALEAKAHIDAR